MSAIVEPQTRMLVRRRLRRLASKPVATWKECPACGAELGERVAHAVRCAGCRRCYTDPGLEPVMSTDADSLGRLRGTRRWRPTDRRDRRLAARPVVWVQIPYDKRMLTPGAVVLDLDLLIR